MSRDQGSALARHLLTPWPKPAPVPHLTDAPCNMPSAERSRPADMVWLCHALGYCPWTVDHAGWVVTPHSPEDQDFSGTTLEAAPGKPVLWQ